MSDIQFTVYRGDKQGNVKPDTTKRPSLQGDEVLVGVTASGLCGTDLHYLKSGIALGHEGVGVVRATGPAVRSLKIGDRVGWGYQHDSCGQCKQCLKGAETYCAKRHMYGSAETDQGSIATAGVWREAFLFRVPDNMSDEDAAPLMCGGATTFTTLVNYNITPTSRVGIIGIGGLGHLAIQFASKMGCETTVFSSTENKKDEATKLGASSFYATKGVDKLDIGSRKLDALIVTTSAMPDWKIYLPLLAPEATIYPLSVDSGNLSIPYMPLLVNGLSVQGSIVAPRHIHKDMLEFAAQHQIKPMVQRYELTTDGVNKCFKDLSEGNMRYRGVMVVPKESRL